MPWGEEKIKLVRLGPGDIFGEISVFNDTTHSASTAAVSHVKLLTIDKISLETIIRVKPSIGIKMFKNVIRELSSRLRETSNLARDLTKLVFHS